MASSMPRRFSEFLSPPRVPPLWYKRRRGARMRGAGRVALSAPPFGEVSCLWHDGEGSRWLTAQLREAAFSVRYRPGKAGRFSAAASVGPERSPLGTRTPVSQLFSCAARL